MACLKIRYVAIDPYYSDQEQSFIGYDIEDCWSQKYDFDRWLGREYPMGMKAIYKEEILQEKL